MSTAETIFLADYTPPAYLVDAVHLTFQLSASKTLVRSKIHFRPNPDSTDRTFFLHGEQLTLHWARIDGQDCKPQITDKGLTATVPDAPFVWEAEVEINPTANTALEGLYTSGGMFCTQCEAEGFRKITYYPDRPDVMAPFTVRIESDQPVMLSNGNPTGQGDGWAEWHDPWPKPAYLFALVAGELEALSDSFTTRSGRKVDLNIYVRPGDLGKCDYAMDALKRSMAWDEEVYGREYDLDLFNIVSVSDFNMGAMENKGLNIFNSSLVLASPETATDNDYERIEAVIAHEYFHNWTGNRITCRDWFQLCLKEGLTVFRDQQFTGDMRGHAVKRIEDAAIMRSHQFREDAGPLAHPVRPSSFVEINNFYTITVYEKGAEIIGMLKRLVGDAGYKAALDLYFERHDGQAVTIEDFRQCFEDATGEDLAQFSLWWTDPGTPHVTVKEAWTGDTLTLTLTQQTKAAGRDDWPARVIPLDTGLLYPDGSEAASQMIRLTEASQTISFPGMRERPTLSINRGFSAPVVIHHDGDTPTAQALRLAHDTDPFNRWDAGRSLTQQTILDMITKGTVPAAAYLAGIEAVTLDDSLDPAFRARTLSMPSEAETAQLLHSQGHTPDPDAIYAAHEGLRDALSAALDDHLEGLYARHQVPGPYSPDATSDGHRSLANTALFFISRIDGGLAAQKQFQKADNMTNSLAALGCLLRNRRGQSELASFAERWADDPLVMNKWFSLQIGTSEPSDTVATVLRLTQHPAFDWKNPNRFRSVIGALAGHQAGFHVASGAGYTLLADWLIKLDAVNPQTTARMTKAFETIGQWDEHRQALMRAELGRIAGTEGLSRDSSEMVGRILG